MLNDFAPKKIPSWFATPEQQMSVLSKFASLHDAGLDWFDVAVVARCMRVTKPTARRRLRWLTDEGYVLCNEHPYRSNAVKHIFWMRMKGWNHLDDLKYTKMPL